MTQQVEGVRTVWYKKAEGNFQCTCGNFFYVCDKEYTCLCGMVYRLNVRLDAAKPEVEIYSRDECLFNYCDAPHICKVQDKCRHT